MADKVVDIDKTAKSMHKALKDFGYTSLELSEVRDIVEDLVAGKENGEVRGATVFKMFIKGWLKDAGVIS